jgi:hypothetical protein
MSERETRLNGSVNCRVVSNHRVAGNAAVRAHLERLTVPSGVWLELKVA